LVVPTHIARSEGGSGAIRAWGEFRVGLNSIPSSPPRVQWSHGSSVHGDRSFRIAPPTSVPAPFRQHSPAHVCTCPNAMPDATLSAQLIHGPGTSVRGMKLSSIWTTTSTSVCMLSCHTAGVDLRTFIDMINMAATINYPLVSFY